MAPDGTLMAFSAPPVITSMRHRYLILSYMPVSVDFLIKTPQIQMDFIVMFIS